MNLLGKATRKMFQPFIFSVCDGESIIFKRAKDGQNLEKMVLPSSSASIRNFRDQFWPNLHGFTILAITCAACSSAIEAYKQTGTWTSPFVGVVYEFALKVNGTLAMEEVIVPPRDRPNEDGKWDAWFQPLIDGTVALALVYRLTIEKSELCHVTRPISFASCCFITAKPKRIESSPNLSTLLLPLTLPVWLCTVASVIVLFALTALTVQLKWWGNGAISSEYQLHARSALSFQSIVDSLLRPIVLQGSSALFFRPATSSDPTPREQSILLRFLFAIWFMATIVLSCGYTALMTAQVVIPGYSTTPQTFEELANSNYKISAVFWRENFELDFKSLNLSYIEKMAPRIQEFLPIDPACYETIFEKGGGACIAPSKMLKYKGSKFTVNSLGERLSVESKETRFFLTVKLGVSHYYPALYEPLDFLAGALYESGFIDLWEEKEMMSNIRAGKLAARKYGERSKIIVDTTDGSHLATFCFNLFLLGYGLALAVLLSELAARFLCL